MTKPYIAVTVRNDGNTHNSILNVYCYQYTLYMELSVCVPRIYVRSPSRSLPGHHEDDPNPEHHRHNLFSSISHNGTIIAPSSELDITDIDDHNDELRAHFLDWLNRVQAISGVKMDMVAAMLKAQKWFNGWKGDFIVKDVIT